MTTRAHQNAQRKSEDVTAFWIDLAKVFNKITFKPIHEMIEIYQGS